MRRVARAFGWLLLLGGAALFVFGALNYERDRSVDELAARWALPPSEFVAIEGLDVHVRDEGPDDPVATIVLLHGTGSSLHTWDGWTEVLRDRYRVLRVDLPGFGLTGPSPANDYSLTAYAEFVVAVLDEFSIEIATLGGNSLGGRIAWATALAAPERVDRLVLVDASGYAIAAKSVPIGFRVAQTPVLRNVVRNVLPRFAVEQSIINVYGDPARIAPGTVDRYFELTTREGNRDALVQRMLQIKPGVMSERISALQQPTLLLWGAKDRLVPLEVGERFDRDIADSTLIVFDDLGHVPHEEAPVRTVEAVITWLNQEPD